MNLMIVEDEIRILNSLAHNIPWERHGIEVVGLAENGKEALALMERRKPDIVLLDIEMPEMNGLALAEAALRKEPQLKIVILSGHDDFPYAQAAIGLGVMNYLLKPAGDDEILNAVLTAADEIRRELAEKHNLAELQRKWQVRLPQLRADFCRNWMLDRYAEWELHKHMRELNLELEAYSHFAVTVCDIDPLPAEESRFTAADLPLLQFSLESIAGELAEGQDCRVFADADGTAVLLFYERGEGAEQTLAKRVNLQVPRLLNVVKECLKLTASAGLGTIVGTLAEVPHSYRQACRSLQERAIYGNEIVIPYLDVKNSEHPIAIDAGFEKKLEIALHAGDSAGAYRLIDEYFEAVYARADSSGLAYEHLLHLSSVFTRMIQSRGWSMQKVLQDDYRRFLSFESLLSKDQIVEWAKRAAGHIAAYREHERRSSTHRLVKQMMEAIEQMLGEEDLSLHTLAERLYVNPSYLSRLFKRETGIAFSGYVLKRRMELAKEHLSGGMKVYDAANASGYRDVSYFAKVFRKYWGVAPSEMKG